MAQLPTGTVTFLFTDIEGSTLLLRELGPDYNPVQRDHMQIMRDAIAAGGGVEIRTEGDAFFAVFSSATSALRAAVQAQRNKGEPLLAAWAALRVRMGMQTGEAVAGGDDYIGIEVNRAARIAAAGHGGQVLLSDSTRAVVIENLPRGVSVRDLGPHRLKDFPQATHLHDLVIDGLPTEFPPLKTLETPSNLPSELTSFVGRELELEAIKSLLVDALAYPYRAGRVWEDPTRITRRLRGSRSLPRWCLLRRTRLHKRTEFGSQCYRFGSQEARGRLSIRIGNTLDRAPEPELPYCVGQLRARDRGKPSDRHAREYSCSNLRASYPADPHFAYRENRSFQFRRWSSQTRGGLLNLAS